MKAFVTRFCLWFPIPEAMIWALNRFELSLNQLNLTGLQHRIGVLILSYEHGMTLDADHFEALWRAQETSVPHMFCLVPRNYMSIFKGKISNGHEWHKCFFFVRINGTSVEESFIPTSCSKWNFRHGTMFGCSDSSVIDDI